MDTIKNYLENMFRSFPNTTEVQRAKEDLYTMMEDKYNELKSQGKTENEAIGIVISEFGNIDELADELGLHNDYTPQDDTKNNARFLSSTEIDDYIKFTKRNSNRIGIGVVLCILSVVPVILFSTTSVFGVIGDTIGIISLFVFIAIAVGIFITAGMSSQRYEYLKKDVFQLAPSTEARLRSEQDAYRTPFTIKIVVGVCLCICSVIPPIIVGALSGVAEIVENGTSSLLFILVAIAVYLFITGGMRMESYKVLLQEEEYNKETKKGETTLTGIVASIYWPVITCIYVGYSLLTNNWGRSWIIWPVTGILFGAIACICDVIEKNHSRKNMVR